MDESSGKIVYTEINFLSVPFNLYNMYYIMPILIFQLYNLGNCEVEEGEPRLANVKGDELTICTDDFEAGDDFTLEVEFTSNPRPQKVIIHH